MSEKLEWKVHTTGLFFEISRTLGHKPQVRLPLQILQNLLAEVAQRATELNDFKLNKLMLRLSLYSIANPDDPEFSPNLVTKLLRATELTEETAGK